MWWGHSIISNPRREKSGLTKGQFCFSLFDPHRQNPEDMMRVTSSSENSSRSELLLASASLTGPAVRDRARRAQGRGNPKAPHPSSTHLCVAWAGHLSPDADTCRKIFFSEVTHILLWVTSDSALDNPTVCLALFFLARHLILYPCCIPVWGVLSFKKLLWV